MQLILDKYGACLFADGFRICVTGKGFEMESGENALFIGELQEGNVCVVSPEQYPEILENELTNEYVGVSNVCRGLEELHGAYLQALAARKRAFFLGKSLVEDPNQPSVPEGLRKESLKSVSDEAWQQRIYQIGTDRAEEMEHSWQSFFFAAEKERITAREFEEGIRKFLDGIQNTYGMILTKEQKVRIDRLRVIYSLSSLEAFREELRNLICEIQEILHADAGESFGRNRMRSAVNYIREHYAEDLNMAVVSNYVSMNYSLFSYELKQYTGKNFVDFLKEIRIEEAKKLLETSDRKVIEIGQMVGYENDKHFMKTFKKVCGISPGEYRKLKQKE